MGSSGGSKPRDLTPREYAALRSPLAQQIHAFTQQGGLPQPEGPTNAPITTGETDILAQLQQLLAGSEFGAAQGALTEQAGGITNPFARVAQLSDAERAGIGQIQNTAFGTSNLQTAGRDQLGRTIAGDYLSPESNPFLQSTIDAALRPIRDQFGDANLANRSQFTDAGQFIGPRSSSPFDVAKARLDTGLANALGDTAGRIAYENYTTERGRQLDATSLAEQLAGADLSRQIAGQQVLGLPRELATADLARRSEAFETDQTRRTDAATQIPQIERAQVETMLQNLQAQALPRLIEELGIERGLAAFQNQQNSLLALLQLAGQISSPSPVSQTGGGASGVGTGIGTALGGIVGGVFGGPAGATIGASAGGSIGGSL